MFFNDTQDTDVTFIDCGAASTPESCSPAPSQVDIDTFGDGNVDIWCPSTDGADCKLVYYDANGAQLDFVDCNAANCSSKAHTTIDTDFRGTGTRIPKIYCISVTDCKLSYIDNGAIAFQTNFVDCDNAGCSSGSMTDLPVANLNENLIGTSLYCPATDNCKIAYFTNGGNTVRFVDCATEECFPTAIDEADPWTGQTNVSSVSLTYDSTNTDLYAMVIKDTDEKAYWKSTDTATISWGAENDFGWSGTGDHLGHISSPQSGAGISQIGAVLRETANFEFSAVPEYTLLLLLLSPFLPKFLSSWRKNKTV